MVDADGGTVVNAGVWIVLVAIVVLAFVDAMGSDAR